MKKLIIVLGFIIPTLVFSQDVMNKEGVFVSTTGEKYSGNLVAYFENGNKQYSYEIKEGKENGKAEFFYVSGKLMEQGEFDNGKKTGNWMKWSEKGTQVKLAEANYKNGEKHGDWMIWDEKGTKRYEMHYDNGLRVGIWKSWDENGAEIETKDYTSK
jgi:antitoxin component YwqK of YwqJK toxin-antitoxin module